MIVKRGLTALAIALLVLVLLLSPSYWFKLFLALVLVLSFYELAQLYEVPFWIMAILVASLIPPLFYFLEYVTYALVVVWFLLVFALKTIANQSAQSEGYIKKTLVFSTTVFIIVCLLLAYSLHRDNLWLLGYFILLVSITDIAGYIFGRCFGRSKIVPSISPNKTLEGYLGALIAVVLFAGATHSYQWLDTVSTANIYILAIGTWFLSCVGDLFFSALKRRARVKNTGQLLPGHGGLLDRMDGYVAAIPFFYFMSV